MNNTKKYSNSISIRCDEKMRNMIDELEENMLLNTTSVMRLALVTLYEKETGKKSPTINGDKYAGL